jgi:hypothetical protein
MPYIRFFRGPAEGICEKLWKFSKRLSVIECLEDNGHFDCRHGPVLWRCKVTELALVMYDGFWHVSVMVTLCR